MSDFPFSIQRRETIPTSPFSMLQSSDHGTGYIYSVPKWNESNDLKLTALSGLTITPNSSSQKVVLQLHLFGEWSIEPFSGNISFARSIGGVETFLDTRPLSNTARIPVNGLFSITYPIADNSTTMETCSTTFVDTPNTTQEITYNVYLKSNVAGSFYLNRTVNEGSGGSTYHSERGISTFTAECKG